MTPVALEDPPEGVRSEPRHAIVYVEDNPSNVAFMEDLLGDLDDVKLLTAPSAELGIELVRAHRPDIVVMDINLPGMSGVEAARALASWPETRDIPVVGLSASTSARGAKPRTSDGFYRHLAKPVNVEELLGVLDELLERARRRPQKM
jgi:CheY-like chemotaxis protein